MGSGAWGMVCFGVQPGFGVHSKEMGHGVGVCWRGMCSGAGCGVWRAPQGCAMRLGWHLRGMWDGFVWHGVGGMHNGYMLWGRTQGGGMHKGQGAWAGGVGLCPRAAPAGIGPPSLPAPPRSAMGLPSPLHRLRGGPGWGSLPPRALPHPCPSLLLQLPGRAVVQLRRQHGGGGAGGRGEHPQRLHPLLPAPQRHPRLVGQQRRQR